MKELDPGTAFVWHCDNFESSTHQERFHSGQLVLEAQRAATVGCRISADGGFLGTYQVIDLMRGEVRVLDLPKGTTDVSCGVERGRVAVSLEADVKHKDRPGHHTYSSLQHVSV